VLADLPYPHFDDAPVEKPTRSAPDPYWKDSVYVSRGEDAVWEEAEELKKRLLEYGRAIHDHISAHEKSAKLTHLLQSKDQLDQEERDLNAEDRRLWDSRLDKFENFQRLKKTMGTAPGAKAVLDNLNLEIDALDRSRRELRERLDQITESRKELQSEIDLVRRSGPFRREDLNELETSMILRRDKYKEAVTALRKSVNRARQIYRELSENPRVKAEIKSKNAETESKNQGLSRTTYKLGPHPGFVRIERRLELQEAWLRRTDSPPAPLRKSGVRKGRNSPGDLPPDF